MVKNFCQYIREFAQQKPQEIAFVSGTTKIDWKTLDLDIRRCAFFLEQQGTLSTAAKNPTVLLLIRDTLTMLHAFFALIQSGKNPVLVNFSDNFHLQEVLTTQKYDWVLYDDKAIESHHINMNTATYINDLPKDSYDEIHEVEDNATMFSLYTSGTSGQPKYIEKTYHNILSELQYLEELVGIRTDHTVVTIVPFIHIYGLLFGILLPCRVGATMVECSKILPSNILNALQQHSADFLVASPVHYESLIKLEDHTPLNKLKRCISSGAPLRECVATQFFAQTNVAILEVYGSTETGGIASRLWKSAAQQLHFFPYIVHDKTLGEGELRIQSPAISPNLHEDWYETGDYISLNEDDSFCIKGRQQHLIKFAGKRIFATQLEEELKALPLVKDAAVVRIADAGAKGERAVAFVSTEKEVKEEQLKKLFAQTSSNASVVYKFFLQNTILRNHNNKVDYPTLTQMAKCKIQARSLKIGVVIPTYNHAHLLKKVIDDCSDYITDILVVVDGSTDNTLNVLQECDVEKVIFTKNRGKGLALKAGFKKAQELGWRNVITIDSDGQHFPSHIWDFVQKIEKNPRAIIVGDRDMSAQHIPGSSKFGKKFTNFWLKVETGKDMSDGQSGFRAYPVAEINRVSTYFSRYEFEVEILARAAWHNIPITSIPIRVEYNPPGGRVSHFRPFMDNVRTSILNTILVTVRVLNLCYLVRFKKIVDKEKS
ncbi:AMP-binding protein [Candidatus Uabimicrobium amorphum]|uniref:Glycosyl transferase n=1 Tax=Uabimicrobium amorphum TaxID=2596890 RepID=A0A5S9IQ86_UABAM|nr:AMP-binding protein [Candidatus Uabimicrobium amorphum]BBM85160.1 glycosyl transferase [Candidatus Uabimicrobium amorphum]